MKRVALYSKKKPTRYALVDDSDYAKVCNIRWYCNRAGYAVYALKKEGRWAQSSMHQLLMGLPPQGLEVDHANNDRLDNQRHNLRFATHMQNMANRPKILTEDSESRFKGVQMSASSINPWRAVLNNKGKKIYAGYWPTEEAAALAYNRVAIEVRGEFAKLNIVE